MALRCGLLGVYGGESVCLWMAALVPVLLMLPCPGMALRGFGAAWVKKKPAAVDRSRFLAFRGLVGGYALGGGCQAACCASKTCSYTSCMMIPFLWVGLPGGR